ncbi:MAG: DnaJ C-terminal domain-containing protein, partial [Candidatus Nanopelagicales bacterium]
GEVGQGDGPPGDLYVEILEAQDEVFQRHGDDLHCTVTIPMTAAALGTSISLDTLDGPEPIDIRSGTQSGTEVKLKGRGVTHLRASGRGDLFVHISVETPTKIDPQQQALLEQLAGLRGEENPTGQVTAGKSGMFSRLRGAFR